MNIKLPFLLLALALLLAAPHGTCAMSYSAHKELLKNSAQYRAADAELNQVWRRTQRALNPRQRAHLLMEQRRWLKHGRDLRAHELMSSMPRGEAYARATRERSEELLRLGLKKEQPEKTERPTPPKPSVWPESKKPVQRPVSEHEIPLLPAQAKIEGPMADTAFNTTASRPTPISLCDGFRISNRTYYGHYVPRPFVSLNLQVRKARRISGLTVNNYEIRRVRRQTAQLPQWRRRNDRNLQLTIFTDTILNDISVIYTDGSVCTIDNLNISKDMTNPYN